MKLLLAVISFVCLASAFIPGKTPVNLEVEILDFLVQSVASLHIEGMPDLDGVDDMAPNEMLTCITKQQREAMARTLENCDKKNVNLHGHIREIHDVECLFANLVQMDVKTGKINATHVKKDVIGATSLDGSRKLSAETSFDSCVAKDMKPPEPVVRMILNEYKLVAKMLEGWIFKYMNGHGPVNATMQAAVEQNLKVHFTMVKGMVCLIQSLLLNGCHPDLENPFSF